MRPDLVPIDHRGQPRAFRLVDRLAAYDRKLAADNARDDHPVRRHALDHRRRLGNLIQAKLMDGARGKLVTAGILPR